MPTKKEKLQIIQKLTRFMQALVALQMKLRMQNKGNEADEVAKKAKALQKEIDKLVGSAIDEWLGEASKQVSAINQATSRLQAAVEDIQKKVEVARNVVKAVGLVDDMVDLAKGFL